MTAGPNASELPAVRRAYMDALMARDSHRARAVIDLALADGAAPADLELHVLAEALNGFGTLWQDGEITVAHEHYVTGITQGVMAVLAARMRRPPVGGRLAVVACPQGEHHDLAARMLGDFLEADAWEVLALGADTPARDLLQLVSDEQPDIVALSVTMPETVPAALETLGALGTVEPQPLTAVGGRGWPRRTIERHVRADVIADDPRELVALLRDRIPGRRDEE